jgi:CDP-glucose 4,6-dehydratase
MESLGIDSLMSSRNTYKNKKVFLTGHTGFKGCWFLVWLKLLGADIKGYSLEPEPEHKLYNFINGGSLCYSDYNNILDYPALEKSILDFQPDFIFHLAAQAIVRTSYIQPIETFSINAIGTANVLEAVKKLSKPCVVVLITTDKVYKNNEWVYPYRETDKLGGYDPYSASKACAELIITSYRSSFFNISSFSEHKKNLVVARAGNVIGGGDWAQDRIMPDIVRSLQKKEPIQVRNPKSIRPWQHVIEPLSAYLLLGAKCIDNSTASTEYNFGPRTTDCLTVKEMVEYAINVWGEGNYIDRSSQTDLHEAGLLKLDISRAETELDWHPKLTAKDAIAKSINWYKKFDGENAYELIKEDIESLSEDFI